MLINFENLTDAELAERIKNDDHVQECVNELENRHSGIFYQMIHQYNKTGNPNLNDLMACPSSFIYKVAKQYDPVKSKFNTFLGNTTRFTCLDEYNKKEKKRPDLDYIDSYAPFENFCPDESIDVNEHNDAVSLYNQIQQDLETEEEKIIFEERLKGATFQEIADKMNNKFSGSWCRILFSQIIEKSKHKYATKF